MYKTMLLGRLIVVLLTCWSLTTTPAQAHPDPLENIKIYSYILGISPENALVYLNRGICYRLVFDFDKSIADFNKAEELGVDGRPLWMNRAMACLPIKRYDEAFKDMTRILEKEPDTPAAASAYFYRGEILFRQGKFLEAVEDYTLSLNTRKSHYVYFVRGDSYSKAGQIEKALEDFGEAIRLADHMVPYWIGRARLFGALGRFDEARADLNSALERQPERYQIFIERAVLSASQTLEASKAADLTQALKFIEDELFFRPKDSLVFADRAKVNEMTGNLEQARKDIDLAVEYSPYTESKYLRLRADFLERHGDGAQATADRTQAAVVDERPMPTATPLPGPTLTLEELGLEPTPNLLPDLQQ